MATGGRVATARRAVADVCATASTATADELLEALDLDRSLRQAAFGREGEVGALVSRVAAFQDELARGFPVPSDPTLSDTALANAVSEAIVWAAPQVTALIQG